MNLPFFIARRYLFAKKSHNVINIISAISAIGMAIGTAALIIILSVYNGFDKLIEDSLGQSAPDILITPSTGKYFIPDSRFDDICTGLDPETSTRRILEENVFLSYDSQQGIAKARGIDDNTLYRGEVPLCEVGSGTAASLGVNPNFISPLEVYYPSKSRSVSMANPLSALNSAKVYPERIYNMNSSLEEASVLMPMDIMRNLLELQPGEISALEIWMLEEATPRQTADLVKSIKEKLGDEFQVLDRYSQNEALFKMMKYEKASIFLILIFIVIIITFNIFGSLTMLIIEKENDIRTFRSMGATTGTLRSVFTTEGWLISLLGLGAGLAIGLLVIFIQQRFGIIKMPGNFVVSAYPVIVKASDVIITAISVALVGYIIALIPSRSKIQPQQQDLEQTK